MDTDLIFAIAVGVFVGQIGVVSVVWAFRGFLASDQPTFIELAAFCIPLMIVGITVYLG